MANPLGINQYTAGAAANDASAKADKSGKTADHEAAMHAHERAAGLFHAAGSRVAGDAHAYQAEGHRALLQIRSERHTEGPGISRADTKNNADAHAAGVAAHAAHYSQEKASADHASAKAAAATRDAMAKGSPEAHSAAAGAHFAARDAQERAGGRGAARDHAERAQNHAQIRARILISR